MANAREIQSRIKSIQDTRKITSAMYLISSTKMKKSKKLLADISRVPLTLIFYGAVLLHTSEPDPQDPASYAGYPACVF